MGKSSKTKRKYADGEDTRSTSTPPSSPSPSSSSAQDDEKQEGVQDSSRRRHSRKHRRSRYDDEDEDRHSSRKDKERRSRKEREREKSRRRREKRDRDRKHRRDKRRRESKRRLSESSQESGSGSSSDDNLEPDKSLPSPDAVVRDLLTEFPGVVADLKQLLQMIDAGQAVDIKGISEKLLAKNLKKLFLSLNLKEKDGVFLLRSNACPTLRVVGPIIMAQFEASEHQAENLTVCDDEHMKIVEDDPLTSANGEAPGPKRKMIGPEMPSAELLAAAAKLTEAQEELREAELDGDGELFIGPPPPAVVTEAESANEAERFEEVTRIMEIEIGTPYDVLGVNHKMSIDNVKKRYWKLSLMVHPDKCSHPQAHQAFIKMNKAFKDLQDPELRRVLDEKIKKKEEEDEMKAELRSMREAALWRRSQGISMEGDDILLAEVDEKPAPKRDEWMTTLPPERKPGVSSTQSTFFSKSGKEGRGDTSVWTDSPSDRAQKAKMNYLEAYNAATAIASGEQQKKMSSTDADMVDQYNKVKRSKTLVQKHQEDLAERSRSKKKPKQQRQPVEEEDWAGKHPWKPWDRERDLTAGRHSVKLDSEDMAQGLTSRFSSGNFQRNFL